MRVYGETQEAQHAVYENRMKQEDCEFEANLSCTGRGWKAAQRQCTWPTGTRSWVPSPAPSKQKQVQILSPGI